ncbi:MAG: hypothetical protein IJY01_01930 [Clostridia bacterium]|nr:hypothetical protein [Clostridia bacterium]
MDIKSYLTADNPKYSIPDGALDTKVVFFDTFPKRRDIERGYATTADETQGGVKILGEATPLLTALCPAVVYISNATLVPTDEDTWKIADELESVRLGPPERSDILRDTFVEKMRAIIGSDKISLIVYKGDMFRRYYNDYLHRERRDFLELLAKRLDEGLKIIPMPSHTAGQISRMQKEYDTFADALIELTDLQ